MIYCIARGSYSDWGIDYAFKSETKRDDLLDKLSEDYHKYDLPLSDDDIDITNIKSYYIHEIEYLKGLAGYYFAWEYESDSLRLTKDKFYLYDEGIKIYLKVTEDQFARGAEYYKHKYMKICNDYLARINYMIEVEDMSIDEVEKILNSEVEINGNNN